MVEIMTIGYEGLTPRKFLDLARRCGVERIIDVRELATSRRAGFAKTALSNSLENAGIAYTHLPELGCPRTIRHEYRGDQNWSRYTKRFCAYLSTCDETLEALAHLAMAERCCLLCFEEDFNFCHRSFVAERLGEFTGALKINHLTGPIRGRVVEARALAAA
jgi:uncharacterized protein (DUF488 family)